MFTRLRNWLKRPHGWVLIPFYIFTAVCIAVAIALTAVRQDGNLSIIAYVFYGFAAVTLGYTVYTVVIFVPVLKKKILELIKKNSFTDRLYAQFGFRTIIFASVALIISVANAVINGTIGIVYLSVWYCALGAYYLLLSAMRGGVLVYHGRKRKYYETETRAKIQLREIRSYRICGILLVFLPLALSFAIMEIVASGRGFVSSGMMIYVTAMYTCYKVVTSVRNLFKARKGDDATVQAIRNVNLADSLVSVLALQTAMFHEFSPEESFGTANAVTGAAVCALTAVMGIYMIVNGCLKIRELKTERINTNE